MKFLFPILLLIVAGCNQTGNKENVNQSVPAESIANDIKPESKKDLNIDYGNIETVKGKEGLYKFDVPKGLYKAAELDQYVSDLLKSKISFSYSETGQVDAPDAIWKKNDLVNKMKENIAVTYSAEKKDWAVVSGTTENGEIVYRKGFYFKPADNHMGENGDNTQPWCITSILEIRYNKEFSKEFDKLIPIISESFKCDFGLICSNCF